MATERQKHQRNTTLMKAFWSEYSLFSKNKKNYAKLCLCQPTVET